MITATFLRHLGSGKVAIDPKDSPKWDVLVSAFSKSERVRVPFFQFKACEKHWLIHGEYAYSTGDLPKGSVLTSASSNESEFIEQALGTLLSVLPRDAKLAVDITGFMRPHLLFLLVYLRSKGFSSFDAIYTEPGHYERKAETIFSSSVYEVRQVAGYEGTHVSDMSDDVVVIGVGYDHDLVGQVIANKSRARLVQLLSLPSLSADMYQESLLRLDYVPDAPSHVPDEHLCFASANDPYVTSAVLDEAVGRLEAQSRISNLYLSPLATKPQVLGFGMYYMRKTTAIPTSIVFPFARKYSQETATGIGRTWMYRVCVE